MLLDFYDRTFPKNADSNSLTLQLRLYRTEDLEPNLSLRTLVEVTGFESSQMRRSPRYFGRCAYCTLLLDANLHKCVRPERAIASSCLRLSIKPLCVMQCSEPTQVCCKSKGGTWVHWPPHLADRFTNIVSKGDQVKSIGFVETGPAGDTKLEVSTLTNLRTGKSSDNPDRPVAAQPDPAASDGSKTVRGTARSFTSAPKGEVDSVMLDDGTWVHWPPHLEDRFTAIISKNDHVKAIGFMETGPKGDTKLEVSRLTNLRSGKSASSSWRINESGSSSFGRKAPRHTG
jgi:hypothetical protein